MSLLKICFIEKVLTFLNHLPNKKVVIIYIDINFVWPVKFHATRTRSRLRVHTGMETHELAFDTIVFNGFHRWPKNNYCLFVEIIFSNIYFFKFM